MKRLVRRPPLRLTPTVAPRGGPRLGRALAVLAAVCAVASACTGVANPAAGSPLVGTYHLALVNGSPPPVLTDSGYVLSGSLSLQSNLNFSLSERDSVAGSPATTFSVSGQWSVVSAQLTLRKPDATGFYGSFNSQLDSLTIQIRGQVDTYAK